MDANVLLLSLHHPDALLSHRPYDPENVHVIGDDDLLQNAVQRDERARSSHARTAMHHNGLLVSAHSVPERSHEPGQSLGRIWHTEIGPCRKVEVSNTALLVTL